MLQDSSGRVTFIPPIIIYTQVTAGNWTQLKATRPWHSALPNEKSKHDKLHLTHTIDSKQDEREAESTRIALFAPTLAQEPRLGIGPSSLKGQTRPWQRDVSSYCHATNLRFNQYMTTLGYTRTH